MRHYSPFEDAACPLSVAFEVLLELVSERRQVAVADQGTGQLEQAEVDVAAPLVAGAQPFEGVQPGEAALDHPAVAAQSRAMGDAAAGDPRRDPTLSELAAVDVVVVAAVGEQFPRSPARPAAPAT